MARERKTCLCDRERHGAAAAAAGDTSWGEGRGRGKRAPFKRALLFLPLFIFQVAHRVFGGSAIGRWWHFPKSSLFF